MFRLSKKKNPKMLYLSKTKNIIFYISKKKYSMSNFPKSVLNPKICVGVTPYPVLGPGTLSEKKVFFTSEEITSCILQGILDP